LLNSGRPAIDHGVPVKKPDTVEETPGLGLRRFPSGHACVLRRKRHVEIERQGRSEREREGSKAEERERKNSYIGASPFHRIRRRTIRVELESPISGDMFRFSTYTPPQIKGNQPARRHHSISKKEVPC
jgi:hypothetical protein